MSIETLEFKLTPEQVKQYDEWGHKCDAAAGCLGGKMKFIFTPTGLGMCLLAECICGESIGLTDINDW